MFPEALLRERRHIDGVGEHTRVLGARRIE
jgi:hypothetical protein